MKRIIIILQHGIGALLLLLITVGRTFAQVADTLTESDYKLSPPKISRFTTYMYDGTIAHIALGVVLLLILYVSYRYWHDNRIDDITHTPHHT